MMLSDDSQKRKLKYLTSVRKDLPLMKRYL